MTGRKGPQEPLEGDERYEAAQRAVNDAWNRWMAASRVEIQASDAYDDALRELRLETLALTPRRERASVPHTFRVGDRVWLDGEFATVTRIESGHLVAYNERLEIHDAWWPPAVELTYGPGHPMANHVGWLLE